MKRLLSRPSKRHRCRARRGGSCRGDGFRKGGCTKKGQKWVGSYRKHEINPAIGQRIRRTITFPDSVTSERAAHRLNRVNDAVPPSPKRKGKRFSSLLRSGRRNAHSY